MARASTAEAKGLKAVARVVAHTAHAREPAQFTTAPIGAIERLLEKTGWKIADVDLFEINEAFACVNMFAMKDLGIPHDQVNFQGGDTALSHTTGASGAPTMPPPLPPLHRTRGKPS